MPIFRVKRTDDWDYDEYDGFIVRASCEDEALCATYDLRTAYGEKDYGKWVVEPVDVDAPAPAVLLASFNAG